MVNEVDSFVPCTSLTTACPLANSTRTPSTCHTHLALMLKSLAIVTITLNRHKDLDGCAQMQSNVFRLSPSEGG